MKALIIGLMIVFGGVFALSPASASADLLPGGSAVCKQAAGSAACQQNAVKKGENPATELIAKITLIIAVVAGIAAVIMIIVSGLRFISSGGDAQKVAGAKNNLVGAIIGLVIIALASTIVSFVVGKL